LNKSLVVSISFVAAIIIGSLTFHHANKPIINASSKKDTADFILDNVTAIETNADGQLQEKIQSPHVTHFQDNHSEFDQPHFIVSSKDGAKWDIKAQHGKANNGFDNIVLWGKVVVAQAANKNNDATSLITEHLTIYPDKKLAVSKDAVTIKQAGTVLKSVGMKIHLDEDRLELLSKARIETQIGDTQSLQRL